MIYNTEIEGLGTDYSCNLIAEVICSTSIMGV